MAQGQFSLKVADFVAKTKAKADLIARKSILDLYIRIVLKSPVGNPELWKTNSIAVQYNNEVANYNAELRNNPENLTRNKRLKRGKKLKDGMDVKAAPGYVGGMFRGNWILQIASAPTTKIDRVDPSGSAAIAAANAALATFSAGPTVYISNLLPYGMRLEYEAWSKQAPAGMVRVSIAEWQGIVNENANTTK